MKETITKEMIDMQPVADMRLHSTINGICQYCGAKSKDIKSGKAGSCEEYERNHN